MAVFAIGLASCATPGPAVRIFLVEDGQQYFVRPVTIRGNPPNIDIDFTVRKTRANPTVTVNVTYHSLEMIEALELRAGQSPGISPAAALRVDTVEVIYSTNALQRWTGSVDYRLFRDFVQALRVSTEDPVVVVAVTGTDQSRTLTRTRSLRRALLELPPL